MAVDVGSAVGYLDLDISKFLASLNQANTEAQNKTKNLGNTLGDGLKTVGDKITGAGKTLTVGLTTPIIGAGVAAVKTTADFDKSMSQVKAVSGATGKDFDALRAKAREMGATTKFSASDAADAMNYMAMAGWKSNDMLGGISGIMDLAAASGEDLATTSDIVTDALTAFGKSADDSGHLADVMAAASSNANTNVSMLGESFKYVAPVAGAMKYSMEDTSVALGLMANAGIKASQGGTSLRTVLTNLAKPTDEMAQAMDDLGVSLQNDDGSMKSLREVMVDLRKGFGDLKVSPEELTEGLGKLDEALANGEITQDEYNEQVERWINKTFKAEDALKAQTAATLAGKTGMSGLLAIVNASEEDFNKLTNAVDNSKGAAHDMSEIMMDNLGGQLQIVKSGLEELAISFGDIMMPAIRDFGSFIQGLVDKLNGLDENQKQMILTIGMVVAAVGPLLLILGSAISIAGGLIKDFNAISEAVTKVKDGFGLLQTVLPTITGPMIAVAAVVGVLVAAFVTLWNTNEEFRNKVIEIFGQVKQTIANFVTEVQKRFDAIKPLLTSFITTFKTVWNQFCNFLAPVFITVFKLISDTLKSVLDIILGVLDVFIGIFTGDWNKVWDGVKKIFTSVWDIIVNAFKTVDNTIQSITSGLVTAVSGFFSSLYNSISGVFSDIIGGVASWATDMATKASNAGSDFVDKVMKFINDLPKSVSGVFDDVISNLTSWASDMFDKGKEGAEDLVDAVVDGVSSLPDDMIDIGWDIVDGVWEGINNAKDYFYDKVSGFFSNLVDTVKGALGISSPSKVFAEEVGQYIPPGAEQGIKKAMPSMVRNTVKDFNDMVAKVSDTINPVDISSASKATANGAKYKSGDFANQSFGGLFTEENLQMLAEMFYGLLKDAPIVNNVNVSMEDGDVLFDSERVGRKLAPIVSRVQATGNV